MDTFSHCTLCPRQCGVNRHEKQGFCRMGDTMKVARAALHMWEEPCISGTRGSGTVFFSGCTLKCAFCQNAPISHDGFGYPVTQEGLVRMFLSLEEQGAHNINIVTGTPFAPLIVRALEKSRLSIPVVWNTGGYETVETLKMLEGHVQVYLPDLKHVSPRLSKLCVQAEDYFDVASAALIEMHRQVGTNVYDEDGMLTQGMIVRHLILPGCTRDAMQVLDFLKENLPDVPVSIMRQYTPQERCTVKGLDRRITDEEYRRVMQYADERGILGFSQEAESADSGYTPPFDGTGVIAE